MPDQYGNPTEAELRMMGYAPNTMAQVGGAVTPIQTSGFTYTNGNHYAGTNVPMSDQAYALLSNNGTQPIATDRDIRGTGGVGQSLADAGKFELNHIGGIVQGVIDKPQRLIFGVDPLGTKIGNAVTGDNYAPLVNQMGGATSQEIRDYEATHGFGSAGAAQNLHNAAAGVAGVVAAGTLANGGLTGGGSGGAPSSLYRGGYNGNYSTQTLGMPGSEAGAGAAAGDAGLPEIVVTGTPGAGAGAGAGAGVGTGLTSSEITSGIGAGAGGLGSALGGGGSAPIPRDVPTQAPVGGNYGANGGLNQVDPNTPYTMGNASDYGSSNLGRAVGNGSFGGGVGTSSLWEDLIPAAGQLLGSYLSGKGAKDASQAQVAASLAGIDEQRREYDTARSDQMPWLTAGTAALGRLADPTAFTASPGYEFVRSEGNRDLNNRFAARGGALSGNALRALDNYNTGLASQEYGNWFNQTADIAGLGQTSAQSLGTLGQNNANNVSNLLTNQGNARASGILGATDAYTNGLNELGQWYGNFRRSRQGAY